MPEEFIGEPQGLEAWLKGPEAAAVTRLKADEVAAIARTIAPVGQPPEDKHPGLYRDSITVGEPTVTGDRVGVPVVAAVPYAAKVEHTYGYHTLAIAAALANDPSPRHPRAAPTAAQVAHAQRVGFRHALRVMQRNARAHELAQAREGRSREFSQAREGRSREISRGGGRYRATLAKAHGTRSVRADRQRSERPGSGIGHGDLHHAGAGVLAHAKGFVDFFIPIPRPANGGPFEAFRHVRELARRVPVTQALSGAAAGASSSQPGQRGSYSRSSGQPSGGAGTPRRRVI